MNNRSGCSICYENCFNRWCFERIVWCSGASTLCQKISQVMRSQQRVLCEGCTVRCSAESGSYRVLVHFVIVTGPGISQW